MDVFGGLKKVSIGVKILSFETALKEASDALVASIEVHCICGGNATHKAGDGFFLCLIEKEMKMVRH